MHRKLRCTIFPSSKSEKQQIFTPKTSPLQKSVKIVWEETFVETQNPLRVKD